MQPDFRSVIRLAVPVRAPDLDASKDQDSRVGRIVQAVGGRDGYFSIFEPERAGGRERCEAQREAGDEA